VPSRRLGRSLGINNIPPKRCSYSCIYCQLGRTVSLQMERRAFYQPQEIVDSVRNRVTLLRKNDEIIDYLAFVPDGEPTLDVNLGRMIDLLRDFGIKIAVITNASLIWNEDVRQDLQKADRVCLKVDTVTPDIWRIINKPYPKIDLNNILEGMLSFAESFHGELNSETMLIRDINDSEEEVSKIAVFLSKLKLTKAYLAVPTRPTSESIEAATEQTLNNSYQIFRGILNRVEYLTGYEGNAFSSTGNTIDDLLSITGVHPMREDAVAEFLKRAGAEWRDVQDLINSRSLVELAYQGKKFYIRKLPEVNQINRHEDA
jgi:wyosine [tRNA(Phe)-imidazoG37] synthetase (radical SAM superfamily)